MEEELNAVLENTELDNTAKADEIKKIIGNNFVTQKKFNDEKAKTAQVEANYNALNAEYTDYKKSKMTDEEKRIAEQEAILAENKLLKTNYAKAEASKIFASAGMAEESYTEIVNKIATDDAEQTKTLASLIAGTFTSQKENVTKSIATQIAKSTPKPESGTNSNSVDNTIELQKSYEDAVKRGDYLNMARYQRIMQEQKMKNK